MYLAKEFWWQKEGDVHEDVFSVVHALEEDQNYRAEDNLSWMRLFSNVNVSGLSSANYAQRSSSRVEDVTLNVVNSMCETVTSEITQNFPKITFLTTGGNWSMKRKAKLLDKFVNGQFYATDIYNVASDVFRDATVFGTGAMKIYSDGDKLVVDRIFPNELYVDDADSFYGKPRQMFQKKIVSREVLLAAYPDFEESILNTAKAEIRNSAESRVSNQVECIESWHLPSREGASDGRHCICLDNVTLLDEPYEKDFFPFVFMRWTKNLLGFWGQGLSEKLLGLQVQINKRLNQIALQMDMLTPSVYLEQGSKIVKSHMTNEVGSIVEYTGTMPKVHVPQTVSGEIFTHLDRLYARAYEIAGISEMSAQAKKPTGLDSGVALREFSDIQSKRFMQVARAYEDMFLQAGRQMVEVAREIVAAGGEYKVISLGDKSIEQIDWKEINLKEDQYVMKIYPTNLLSSTPAAKLQTIQEMTQAGLLSASEGRGLLNYPDLESVNQLATAFIDDVDLLIEQMLEKGLYHPPEAYSNLPFAIERIQSAYLRAKIEDAPEENLELLRRYVDEAIRVLQTKQMEEQAAQVAMAPQGAAPPAQGALPEEGGLEPGGLEPGALPPEAAGALGDFQEIITQGEN